jgi:diguanylate cyclase (GGDEF)-like protein
MSTERSTSTWVVRASIAGLLGVLSFLAGFSILTQRRIADRSEHADQTNRVSEIYQDARFWVGQEESLERKYRLEPTPEVHGLHEQSEQNVRRDLQQLLLTDRSQATRAAVDQLLRLSAEYELATDKMFRAVDARDTALVIHYDHAVVDPVFGSIEKIVYGNAGVARRHALAESAGLRHDEKAATRTTIIAFALGLGLLLGFALIIVRFRRRLSAAHLAEIKQLAEIAITDPLTGLRNHRAFHDDLARELQRVARTRVPVSLVMLDLDGLKAVNDSSGHQVGDDHLKRLAGATRATVRGSDCAYRIGGDEFAVILHGVRAWNALEFVQRLNLSLARTEGVTVGVSAGVAEAIELTPKDALIRKADLALISSKRAGQQVEVYTPEMEPDRASAETAEGHDTRTLANALALAVDAKDSYTRSHCQTVSQLCVLIATELGLGFDAEHIAQIRIAGLLHDVGKIGVPDSILNKPDKLTDDEYEEMKTHTSLGHDIVAAAGLPVQAEWVLHHHERFDGHGYPSGLSAADIPLESRIILVADAFEAMTSDRSYRRAPGKEFAVAELIRYAGTQFDAQAVDALRRILESPKAPNIGSLADIAREPAAI